MIRIKPKLLKIGYNRFSDVEVGAYVLRNKKGKSGLISIFEPGYSVDFPMSNVWNGFESYR